MIANLESVKIENRKRIETVKFTYAESATTTLINWRTRCMILSR